MALTQTGTDGIKDDAVTADKLANAINTDIAAKAVLTGSTNNQITTVTGANAIQGESNLTFDGNNLDVAGGCVTTFGANTTNEAACIKVGYEGSSKGQVRVYGADASTTGSLEFKVCEGDGSDDHTMTLDGSGRLRVGNTTESADSAFDDLIIGNHSTHTGISILSGSSSQGALGFAKSGALSDGYLAYTHNSTATDSSMYLKSSGKIQLDTAGVERLRIDSSGRVLIGTTTEGEASVDNLTVGSSGDTGITIRSGTTSNGAVTFSDGTSGADEYRGMIDYDHDTDFLRFYTNAVERLRIDSSGAVTKPSNPAFRASGSNSWVALAEDATLELPANSEHFDNGSNYSTSTYRFTAPVAGTYQFFCQLYWKPASSSSYMNLAFSKNGSEANVDWRIFAQNDSSTSSRSIFTSSIMDLSANDYVSTKLMAKSGSIDYYMGHSSFEGYLLG